MASEIESNALFRFISYCKTRINPSNNLTDQKHYLLRSLIVILRSHIYLLLLRFLLVYLIFFLSWIWKKNATKCPSNAIHWLDQSIFDRLSCCWQPNSCGFFKLVLLKIVFRTRVVIVQKWRKLLSRVWITLSTD